MTERGRAIHRGGGGGTGESGKVVGKRSEGLARAIIALINLDVKQGSSVLEVLIGVLAVLNILLGRYARGMPEELVEFHGQVRKWMVELAEVRRELRGGG
jgi:hypothetical protein